LKRQDVLRNLDILTDDGMRNAGVLLFAKMISRFCLQASVTCVLFRGTSKVKILDKQTYQGGILDTYRDTMSYIFSHLNTEFIIKGGPREEVLELPEEALREAVLNAIAHRDYRSTSNIQVHIFQDRVEIINPGGLVPGLSKQKTTQKKARLTTQKTRARILSLMAENPAVTREQLADAIGVSSDGIRYHLRKLKQEDIIRRVGPDKGGFWEVLA